MADKTYQDFLCRIAGEVDSLLIKYPSALERFRQHLRSFAHKQRKHSQWLEDLRAECRRKGEDFTVSSDMKVPTEYESPTCMFVIDYATKNYPAPRSKAEECQRNYIALASIHDQVLTQVERIDNGILPQSSARLIWSTFHEFWDRGPQRAFIEQAFKRVKSDLASAPAETEQRDKLDGKTKKRDDGGEICSEDEFRRFISIQKRLMVLSKELLKPPEERSSEFRLQQIDLDEDLTEFWPTMRKIGQRLDLELPETPALAKDFICDREITTLYDELGDLFPGDVRIDGVWLDEFEIFQRMKQSIDAQSRARDEVIEKIDRMKVRLCRHFGVDPYESLENECRDEEKGQVGTGDSGPKGKAPKKASQKQWKPPKGYKGSKEIASDVPRSTLQGWAERHPPKKVVKDPQTQECYYPNTWLEERLKTYKARRKA